MKIKIKLTAFAFLLSLSLSIPNGFANIPVKPIDDDEHGGYYEVDLSDAPSFFLKDADDVADVEFTPHLKSGLKASIPSIMPCHGIITSHYGWRTFSKRRGRRGGRRFGRMHLGVDIAAPIGSRIFAPADGRVAFAGRKGGYGLTVMLDHGGDLMTLFGHNSEILVDEGQVVKKGQAISEVGMTGHSTGPHVHYEVRISGNAVNPTRFF